MQEQQLNLSWNFLLADCQHRSPTQLLSELLWKLLSSLSPISIPFAFFFIPLCCLFTHIFYHLKKAKKSKRLGIGGTCCVQNRKSGMNICTGRSKGCIIGLTVLSWSCLHIPVAIVATDKVKTTWGALTFLHTITRLVLEMSPQTHTMESSWHFVLMFHIIHQKSVLQDPAMAFSQGVNMTKRVRIQVVFCHLAFFYAVNLCEPSIKITRQTCFRVFSFDLIWYIIPLHDCSPNKYICEH